VDGVAAEAGADDGSPDDGTAGIMAQFAAAMQEARRRAPRHELPGILRALKDARRAALAAARRNAANNQHGRRLAVRLRRIRPQRAPAS